MPDLKQGKENHFFSGLKEGQDSKVWAAHTILQNVRGYDIGLKSV